MFSQVKDTSLLCIIFKFKSDVPSVFRAIYRDADIYIMDDPLSAVDVEVARHLYEKLAYVLLYSDKN